MKLNDLYPSNYLKKEDVTTPVVATIKLVVQEEITGDHGKELKPVMHFTALLKPLILNRGNGETVAALYGDDTDAWVGRPIEIYADPSIMFGGKRVGGVRVRAPQRAAAGPAAPGTWDVSDGTTLTKQLTTDQVHAFLADAAEMGVPNDKFKVRAHPSGPVEPAPAWLAAHPKDAPAGEDIPF